MKLSAELQRALINNVHEALLEDIGTGDISAMLIPEAQQSQASIITRESMLLCGLPWVHECFRQLDPQLRVEPLHRDGTWVEAGSVLVRFSGSARILLSGERTALNFLQLLSGTATTVYQTLPALSGTHTRLLDTRKTIPGLRQAQKYAVRCAGGSNHRMGLFDAFLIKENHIMAAGGILAAVSQARIIAPGKPVEVEVETLNELEQALMARADIIMLDNFNLEDMRTAVGLTAGRALLEASGGLGLSDLQAVACTGVDYISMGSLTKHVKAIDLSMRLHA